MKWERVEGVLMVFEKRASSVVPGFRARLYADVIISSVPGGCRCFRHQGIDLKCLMSSSSSGDGWRLVDAVMDEDYDWM